MKKSISPCPLQNKTCLYLITCARNKNTWPIYTFQTQLQKLLEGINYYITLIYQGLFIARITLDFILFTRILVKVVVKINYDKPLILKRILDSTMYQNRLANIS